MERRCSVSQQTVEQHSEHHRNLQRQPPRPGAGVGFRDSAVLGRPYCWTLSHINSEENTLPKYDLQSFFFKGSLQKLNKDLILQIHIFYPFLARSSQKLALSNPTNNGFLILLASLIPVSLCLTDSSWSSISILLNESHILRAALDSINHPVLFSAPNLGPLVEN